MISAFKERSASFTAGPVWGASVPAQTFRKGRDLPPDTRETWLASAVVLQRRG